MAPERHHREAWPRSLRLSSVTVITLLAIVLLCLQVIAAPLFAESRIGFVNAARVSAEAPQAEEARASLEREFSPRDRQIADEQSEIRRLEEQLSRDSSLMGEDDQRRLQRDVVARKRELRQAQEEFREDFNLRRNEELGRLQRQIVDTINDLAEERGFDLIVSEGVIFASDKVDLTEDVLERLRQDLEDSSS